MPIKSFKDFIEGFSDYCSTTKGYFKNNKLMFIIGGIWVLGGLNPPGNVYSIDYLYNNQIYNEDYKNIIELLQKGNNGEYKGVSNIKLLYYCYGNSQPPIKDLSNTKSKTHSSIVLSKSMPQSDRTLIYDNFNVVFFTTLSGFANNNRQYTDKQMIGNIKSFFTPSSDHNIYEVQNKILNNTLPPFIWTDVNANYGKCNNCSTKWGSYNPSLYSIFNNRHNHVF